MPETANPKFHATLLHVATKGYANPHAKIKRNKDGSHDLVINYGDYRFHDNWFGGEPFGGREVITKNGKVFWMMTYFGALKDKTTSAEETYGVALKEAMRHPDKSMPIRGPKKFIASNEYIYEFQWEGDLNRFNGFETIKDNSGKLVYKGEISGGVVDL